MAETTRTVMIEDQRPEGEEAIAKTGRIYAARLVEQGLTVDDLGSETVPLRRADDYREVIADAVRAALAKTAKFTVTKRPNEVAEEPVAPANIKTLEKLSDVERACLESMRQDFNRGIVQIDDDANEDAYQAALKQDKTAGQSWEVVQGRLLANEAALLKKAVELSQLTGDQEGKGACLIGVYENGELAIRQRTQEIVNARRNESGELKLLFHPDAVAQELGQWAKAVEIIRAVKVAGYHVPAAVTGWRKKGLVAAFETVTGANYVASKNRKEIREAMLECPDNVSDNANVCTVYFYPSTERVGITHNDAHHRYLDRGAVLWLKG